MIDPSPGRGPRAAATAARIYDYLLGGVHNFPADQAAAEAIIAQLPDVRMVAHANRAFVRRAVRYLIDAGVRQFLDIGSGIPTEGNVHDIAQTAAPDSRVVYVDLDPVAVSESQELLDSNPQAIAIRGDLRAPHDILNHAAVAKMLDFSQPVGLLLAAVLHFVPNDSQAYTAVDDLVAALAPGSFLVVSHGASETFDPAADAPAAAAGIYQTRTATPGKPRTRSGVERFVVGLEIVAPGMVWVNQWHPELDRPAPPELAADPARSGEWAAVGRKPSHR